MSLYNRKFETREVIPLLRRGLLVEDGDAVSRADNSGCGNRAHVAKAPRPVAGGAEVPWPRLNAGKEVPRPHANAGKAPGSCTGGTKGPRPDAVVLCQSAVRQCLALRRAAVLTYAKKACTIHHMAAGELGDSMLQIY